MEMNKKIIAVVLILAIILAVIVFLFINKSESDKRCLMDKPIEIGTCKPIHGWYYDYSSNSCESISGCSVEGETPFPTSEECKSSCIK